MKSIEVTGLTGDDPLYHYELACETYRALQDVDDASEVRLDLTGAKWTIPMYLCPVAVAIQKVRDSGTEVEVRCSNKIRPYIEQIGFPDGYLHPSDSYENALPLCLLNTETDEDAIEIVGSKIYELLSTHLPD